jgi:hypothetical protein
MSSGPNPSESGLFTSPQLSAFWDAYKACRTPIEENKLIQLPDNVFILGNGSIRSPIYIRACYPKLLETTLSIVESEQKHLIIFGNPGIGKTYFGYLLLLHLARSGATVIYEGLYENTLFLLTPHGAFHGTRFQLDRYLKSRTTFYIVDGTPPVHVPAKTILLTSLRRDIWHQFSKSPCRLRHMPLWSENELYTCRSLLYSNIPEELVKKLYFKWGGIARYVLEKAFYADQQALLELALKISNIDSVMESFGGSGIEAEVSSCLIHISVKDEFRGGPYQFTSAYVADEIYSRVYARDRNNLISFLSATQGIGDTGQLRGTLFEKHAHTMIARGGSFKIRDLHTEIQSTLEIPMDLTTFLFSNSPQVEDRTNCYFRPVSKIFESVDSFIKPNLLFQMTFSKDQPCKQTGLRDVLKILGNPLKPELYFVVPPDRFASFKYQSYHGNNGKVLTQEGIVANVRRLSQFVLTFERSSK